MLKSLKSNSYRFVVVLLLLTTLLTFTVGGVITVSAMAAPTIDPELTPIFDTQIYQFQEYCEENLSDAQYNILYFILGAWIVSQGGMQNYTINDPFATEDGVINWFKSIGLRATNTLLNWGVGYDPVTGTDLREEIGFYVWYAMGAAELASKFTTFDDFIEEVQNSQHYFVPFDQSLQIGLNTVLELEGGLYNWQNTILEWVSDTSRLVAWPGTPSQALMTSYFNYMNEFPPLVRTVAWEEVGRTTTTFGSHYADAVGVNFFNTYKHMFINTSNHKVYLVNDAGISPSEGTPFNLKIGYYTFYSNTNNYDVSLFRQNLTYYSYTYSATWTPYEVATHLYSQPNEGIACFNNVILSDWVQDVYYGPSWQDKHVLINSEDLDFGDIYTQYYLQVQNDQLLDLKGLISSLIGITSLQTQILSNLYDTDGTLNVNPSLIQVSIQLPDDNPLPVNLNDIQLYTDNEYLDVVKQRSLQASETIGEYVAFWHNCDAELVYAVLGSFIVILIGAFIGKWGHS